MTHFNGRLNEINQLNIQALGWGLVGMDVKVLPKMIYLKTPYDVVCKDGIKKRLPKHQQCCLDQSRRA